MTFDRSFQACGRFRRLARRTACLLTSWCLIGALGLAQQPGTAPPQPGPPPPQSGAPPTGESTVIVSGRTLYVEGALVLVLFGAALFAVCRSSRRN